VASFSFFGYSYGGPCRFMACKRTVLPLLPLPDGRFSSFMAVIPSKWRNRKSSLRWARLRLPHQSRFIIHSSRIISDAIIFALVFVTVDTAVPGSHALLDLGVTSPSPPPVKREPPEHKALLHGIISQHPHTAHRPSAYTTSTTGNVFITGCFRNCHGLVLAGKCCCFCC